MRCSKWMERFSGVTDLVCDALENGRRIRVLNIIDDYNREAIWVDARFHYPSEMVVRVMEILNMTIGLPDKIRVDNGPEFLSKTCQDYCKKHDIQIAYIQAGKPTQNAYIERFNRMYSIDQLYLRAFILFCRRLNRTEAIKISLFIKRIRSRSCRFT